MQAGGRAGATGPLYLRPTGERRMVIETVITEAEHEAGRSAWQGYRGLFDSIA